MQKKKLKIGGQAVINGVMMRSPNYYSIAIRKDKGNIKVKHKSIPKPKKIFKLPLIRGIYNLVDMLKIGFKALNYSADEAVGKQEKVKTYEMVLVTILTVVFALAIFKFIPLLTARFFERTFTTVAQNYLLFNVIDGISKILIFILYIVIISSMKDIKDVFRYHGAEHKTVNCYEAGKKLTVKNCKKFSRLHLRCGTSFLIIVLLISIFVYVFIPKEYSFFIKFGLRILLLPIIIAVSYESIKLFDKFKNSIFTKILSQPGLLVQRLTCYEPNEKQLEVAIKSIDEVLKLEKG